jgi:NAD-dependent dihydropyrimidine dehydrogenase PreA subunit
MAVFELVDIGGTMKSNPVNANECISCSAFETICPEDAIKVID